MLRKYINKQTHIHIALCGKLPIELSSIVLELCAGQAKRIILGNILLICWLPNDSHARIIPVIEMTDSDVFIHMYTIQRIHKQQTKSTN